MMKSTCHIMTGILVFFSYVSHLSASNDSISLIQALDRSSNVFIKYLGNSKTINQSALVTQAKVIQKHIGLTSETTLSQDSQKTIFSISENNKRQNNTKKACVIKQLEKQLKPKLVMGYPNSTLKNCYINASLKFMMHMLDASAIERIQQRKMDSVLECAVKNAFIALYYVSYSQESILTVYLNVLIQACMNLYEGNMKLPKEEKAYSYLGFRDIKMKQQSDAEEFMISLNVVLCGENNEGGNMIKAPQRIETFKMIHKDKCYPLVTHTEPSTTLTLSFNILNDDGQISNVDSFQEALSAIQSDSRLDEFSLNVNNLKQLMEENTANSLYDELKKEFPPSDKNIAKDLILLQNNSTTKLVCNSMPFFPENTQKCCVFFTMGTCNFKTKKTFKDHQSALDVIKKSKTFSMQFAVRQQSGQLEIETFIPKAILAHVGSELMFGHYIAYLIENDGEIFCHNDAAVCKIPRKQNETIDDVLKRAMLNQDDGAIPIVIFYEKL